MVAFAFRQADSAGRLLRTEARRHVSAALSGAAVDARTGRYGQAIQQPSIHVPRWRTVISLGRRRAVGSADQVIVQYGQRLQLSGCKPVQRMVLQRKLTVATLHTGATPLKEVGADLCFTFQVGLHFGGERSP